MNKVDTQTLKQRQAYPLDLKIAMSKSRIADWYEYHNGKVCVSFSGGKDSTVLLHLVRSIYPDVPAVFCDTGLEYPEIKEFIKTIDNVTIIKPKYSFKEVIDKYGYPVVSKEVSRYVYELRNSNSDTVRNLRLHGKDNKHKTGKLSNKWKYLVDTPIKISDKCCYHLKKAPLKRYLKQINRLPYIGTMACESRLRMQSYLMYGCNAFNSKNNKKSTPLAFWLEKDIWEYIKSFNIPYASVYDTGVQRTGCIFCCFGVNMEKKGETRFDKLRISHPKLYKYCMEKLNLKEVLSILGVSVENSR